MKLSFRKLVYRPFHRSSTLLRSIKSTSSFSYQQINRMVRLSDSKDFLFCTLYLILFYLVLVDAMAKIKFKYRVKKNWQGDPCVPVDYSWEGLECLHSDNNTSPRSISLNLSSSGLTGQIDPAFANLTSIKKLDLSNNSLTGKVPDFLASLPNLSELNLEGNKLSGSIPAKLLEKSKDSSLSLRFGGNPDLCQSSLCQTTTKKKTGYIVPVVASVAGLLILFTALALIWHFKRRSRRGTISNKPLGVNTGPLDTAKRYFIYSEVVNITNNFERVLGKGGFGKVYHGFLNGDQVAVKILSEESAQGYKEFRAEVELLMRVHHTNLTSLIGYCNENNHMALIYEYMANGNLGDYLSGKSSLILSWKERLQVSLDAAQGLEYLHYGCKPPIVHRDVKPANILLNEKLQAKIADFGLSRSFPVEGSSQVSTVVAGTIGYLDPEYYTTRQMNEKSDVYSFGVVLLEVITGLPAISRSRTESVHLCDQVGSMLANGDIKGIVDQRLGDRFEAGSAWKITEIALACTSESSEQRPTMSQVVMELKQSVFGRVTDRSNHKDPVKMLTMNLDTEMVPRAR
ncbi:Protein kinase domain [Arabidopsis thaliana x Arabidopsis arenosa]|uniref:Protein kinase domain n=1 Tax=Arabidopsis thaliana x Arabidopsis arenosa TaxID=1240361 RepID=A0A8T1Y1Q7_9BRAS|nr:Protein kinase domain [Arabidopsis thaliana x Arabidopsis arenosa]